ncbi:MAG: hypothetical protein FWF08_01410 [Oscillospiraceae bacterium]|nr:hypothetical protein [Oscillospiraceae bacterium]
MTLDNDKKEKIAAATSVFMIIYDLARKAVSAKKFFSIKKSFDFTRERRKKFKDTP